MQSQVSGRCSSFAIDSNNPNMYGVWHPNRSPRAYAIWHPIGCLTDCDESPRRMTHQLASNMPISYPKDPQQSPLR